MQSSQQRSAYPKRGGRGRQRGRGGGRQTATCESGRFQESAPSISTHQVSRPMSKPLDKPISKPLTEPLSKPLSCPPGFSSLTRCHTDEPLVAPKLSDKKIEGKVEGKTHTETSSCNRSPFTVIKNNGNDGRNTSACLWISLSHALYINYSEGRREDAPSAIALRDQVKFPQRDLSFDIYAVDQSADGIHGRYLQQICDIYNLRVDFYMANYTGARGSVWIGKPAMGYTDSTKVVPWYNRVSIVAFPGHYELIVSKTATSSRRQIERGYGFDLRSYRYTPEPVSEAHTGPSASHVSRPTAVGTVGTEITTPPSSDKKISMADYSFGAEEDVMAQFTGLSLDDVDEVKQPMTSLGHQSSPSPPIERLGSRRDVSSVSLFGRDGGFRSSAQCDVTSPISSPIINPLPRSHSQSLASNLDLSQRLPQRDYGARVQQFREEIKELEAQRFLAAKYLQSCETELEATIASVSLFRPETVPPSLREIIEHKHTQIVAAMQASIEQSHNLLVLLDAQLHELRQAVPDLR